METRWAVWTLPSTPIDEALKERGLVLTLSVATDDQDVIDMIELAAENAGMVMTRLHDLEPA